MGRKRAEPINEAPPVVVEEETTTEKKSRKLDVEALRKYASVIDSTQGDVLTAKIDAFVVADEGKKLASKKLRDTLKAIKLLNEEE